MAGCSSAGPTASDEAPADPVPGKDADPLALAAAYAEPHAGKPHLLASGTKAFNGILALAAAEDGLLTLDERVAETIPAWSEDPAKSQITIRQLLHLTAGFDTRFGRACRLNGSVDVTAQQFAPAAQRSCPQLPPEAPAYG
ncbi:MAG: serine hydrolase, partial [Bacteroidetes bacterium]|nr:serine hydrolase [Bacteroidota bacterium]